MLSRSAVAVATRCVRVLISMLAVPALTGGVARAEIPVAGFTGIDGTVYRAAIDGQKLVVAGNFAGVGLPCGSWLSFDLGSGAASEAGPVVTGTVWEAIPDGEGGFFLAGAIVAVNGSARQGLARLHEDGSLSSWAPAVFGGAEALALRGDTLFVGGIFTAIDGTPRSNLAALDANTGAVLAWNVPVDGRVQTLDLVEDTLYIGGNFRAIAGLPRPAGIGAIDARTAATTDWTLPLVGSPFAGGTPFVTQIVHDGSRLFVGGDFNAVGESPAGGLAVVDRASGALQPSAHPSGGGGVERIVVHGGRVYVSGEMVMGTPAGGAIGLFAISRSTLQIVPWAPAFPRYHRNGGAIAALGDRVFVSESWRESQYPPEPLCVVDTLSGTAVPFPASVRSSGGSTVFAISGGRLFAGGLFRMLTSTPRPSIAEIDLATGLWTSRTFELLPGEVPNRVAADAGRVFVRIGAEVVAFDGASAPIWRRPFSYLKSMLAAKGHLIVVGVEDPGGASEQVLDLDPATGVTRPWAPTFANPAGAVSVNAVAGDDQRLYVGGFFQSVDAQPTGGVATFRWSDLGLESVSFSSILGVRALAVSPGHLIAVGDVAGRPSPTLAALDRASGALLPWAPLGGAWLEPFQLADVAVLDNDVFVAYQGPWSAYGPTWLYRASLSTPSWTTGPVIGSGQVWDLVSGAGRLVVVGEYLGLGTTPASGVGVLASPTLGVPWSVQTRASRLHVWPDPARDGVAIRWSHSQAPARLGIFDVTGRRVREVEVPPGHGDTFEWDLRGSNGGRVAAGVHFAVVTAGDGTRATARFVVLK